jgi:predicted component of type VI protein secretion system
MGKLVLKLPDGRTRDIPLELERITIGRRADNHVCLPFPAVSGEHAAVVTILDDSFLEDLNSRNGTLVNGKPVARHFLRDHDEIDIGRQILVYVSGFGDASAAADASAGKPDSSSRSGRRIDTAPLVREPAMATTPAGSADETRAAVSPATAALEVVEGPGAGRVVPIDRDVFVIGRVGLQVAAARRTPDGLRLVHVEGDTPPRINGAALPDEGSLLVAGDEIEIAGARLRLVQGR